MKNKTAGFSLLELLIVLLLFAILTAVAAPATGRFLDNLSFRKQTQKVMAILRYARLLAVSSAANVHVTLYDENGQGFRITGAEDEFKPMDMGLEEVLTMEPAEIVYYPEGQATPATLTFSKGDRRRIIALDLLTALPVIIEPDS